MKRSSDMNSGQLELQNDFQSLPAAGKSRNIRSHGAEKNMAFVSKAADRSMRLRLKELEAQNARLEFMVKQRTSKLIEVVNTNTHFISIIAHDLRSPFNAIIGILNVLKESLSDFTIDEIEKFVNIASDSANRTLNLLDNLLEWTISQHKGKSYSPGKINLSELLAYEIESFKALAQQKQITLQNYISSNIYVTADIQMVKTIIRNLVSNAIKFTNNGGEIAINATEDKNFVEVAIKDNGIGISLQAQKELFKLNILNSTAGTRNEKGTGLGLLICKEFVDIHCGNIWVESEPGKGSTFKFTLPPYLL